FPDLLIHDCRPMQQGWDSMTLLINGDTIFRFARRPDVLPRLAREVRLLPRLAESLPVPIPRFTYVGVDSEGGVRFVGYPALGGTPPSPGERDTEQARSLIQQLATFLDALHRFPLAEAVHAGVTSAAATEWQGEYVALYGEVREYVFPLLSAIEREHVAVL